MVDGMGRRGVKLIVTSAGRVGQGDHVDVAVRLGGGVRGEG